MIIAASVLLVLIALAALDYARWRAGRRRVERSFSRAQTPQGEIPYLDIGPRDGPPVLVATGGGAGIDSIHALPWLTDAGYRVIAVSRPGYYGVPLAAAPSLTAQADLYAAVLATLDLSGPVHVFGLSAGGPTALHYAARHPSASLLLWCAVTGPYAPNPEALESAIAKVVLSSRGQALLSWLLSRSARWLPRMTMAAFLRTESELSAPEIDAVVEQTLSVPAHRQRFRRFVDSTTPMTKLYTGMMDEVDKMDRDWSVDWASIDAPTLAVASPVDRDVPIAHVERLREALPAAQILELRAGGHFVWWGDEGEQTIAASLAHLAAHAGAAQATTT